MGTPVDPVPAPVRAALVAGADAPGYPQTAGTAELRRAARQWLVRRAGAPEEVAVLPVVGTKELVALLPWLLGVTGTVTLPALAYPTYEVGARLAGLPTATVPPSTPGGLVWVNSPSNPTGAVTTPEQLRADLADARRLGATVAADECYLEFGWSAEPVSVLHPSVHGGDLTGLLAVHSLSKRSNLAGYRLGVVAGDPELVARLLEVRKHAGLMVPAPVQAAGVAAWDDDAHVSVQRARYAARREQLLAALPAAGLTVEHSEAGLYLWASAGEDCWATVARLADAGILVAPGEFYGAAGDRHVRVALTATDERVAAACTRLAG